MRFYIKDIIAGTGGALITSAIGPELFSGVSIDSRTAEPGDVFFALKGEFHDGHDYLREAWERGAALMVVESDAVARGVRMPPVPLVVVKDTVAALQSLASHWRDRHTLPVLAVVGSVGKTTTKEMVASILSTRGSCLKNTGNLNNHIGLPLSLLELADYHSYAVLEIGANLPGEIRHLASLLKPAAAVVTRIGWAHLEGFGNMKNLIVEKGSVLEVIPESGWCAINADDPMQAGYPDLVGCDVISYGIGSGDVRAEDITLSEKVTSFTLVLPSGAERVQLKGFGRHFIENALAAAALTLPLKIPMEQLVTGLGNWRPEPGRGRIISPVPGVHFIDDTYNANPLSVEAALASLSQLKKEGVTVAVLGEMKELGDYFEEGHKRIGSEAARMGIDYLVAVGSPGALISEGAVDGGMDPARVFECRDNDEAVRCLQPLLAEGVWVLFKGSRAAKVEQIMKPFFDTPIQAGTGRN